MAKPWDELNTQISTDDEFNKAIAYKGLTCMLLLACNPLSARAPAAASVLGHGPTLQHTANSRWQVWRCTQDGVGPRQL